jgi:hypothetical protein
VCVGFLQETEADANTVADTEKRKKEIYIYIFVQISGEFFYNFLKVLTVFTRHPLVYNSFAVSKSSL